MLELVVVSNNGAVAIFIIAMSAVLFIGTVTVSVSEEMVICII